MKTECELLELAARAAGLEYHWVKVEGGQLMQASEPGSRSEESWNPLTNDGDALRLAVMLKLHILHNDPGEGALWVSAVLNKTMLHAAEEFLNEAERPAATRRAITRAAAEIQEAKEKT